MNIAQKNISALSSQLREESPHAMLVIMTDGHRTLIITFFEGNNFDYNLSCVFS